MHPTTATGLMPNLQNAVTQYWIKPLRGAFVFGVLFFFARVGADWLFRWRLTDGPRPPLWSIFLTIGFGTVIASYVVFLLLTSMKREAEAIRELNHELRNALQVLSYVIPTCDPQSKNEAVAAIERITSTLERVSTNLNSGVPLVERRNWKHRMPADTVIPGNS